MNKELQDDIRYMLGEYFHEQNERVFGEKHDFLLDPVIFDSFSGDFRVQFIDGKMEWVQ